MITYYTADYIIPVTSPVIKGGVVALDEKGLIIGVYHSADPQLQDKELTRYEGVLIPGFVNGHCHLELSHMRGKVPTGTGLPKFLSTVMSQRVASQEDIAQAMIKADQDMYAKGIQVVGDHVNTAVSAAVKAESPICYHTFVELIGFDPAVADERVDQARDTEYEFEPQRTSITPHAAYSCSKKLLRSLSDKVDNKNIFSIHNQESDEENKFFRYKQGAFLDFYKENNISHEHVMANGKNALQNSIQFLPEENRVVLVHNTYTAPKDMDYVTRIGRDVYYCLCPKANLYIEGRLPKVQNFVLSKQKLMIGTDSLASNDTLDILEELKAIHEEFEDLSLETTIAWATINGATALRLEDKYGSLEVGKTPGLLLIKGLDGLSLTAQASVQRIV
ncbi:amidohydrolase family protein [Sphingobacterium corticibacter]|uniref:Amidohydrolase n=1 Tax=Sphingobacterium corticibacter TaxID=2171749 RepID=A0A2T8HJK4_9SPHI|nr:amidohydrolase family protein [Sphingobacterium corticibacter]PVH25573.1 amidohydrolase [Sphingobacterium corticibacter]